MDKLKELADLLYDQKVKEGWKNVSMESCLKRAIDYYRIQELVKESDSLPCVSEHSELFDFKNWWNSLPDESDDRLFMTKGTIERFLKSNSR